MLSVKYTEVLERTCYLTYSLLHEEPWDSLGFGQELQTRVAGELGVLGAKTGGKRFLFSVLMPFFLGGLVGWVGPWIFFCWKGWYGCMYLCHYVCFFGSKMNKSYSEMANTFAWKQEHIFESQNWNWRQSRTWPFKEAKKKTFFFLGDSKLSCVFFSCTSGASKPAGSELVKRHERQALPFMLN